MPIALVHRGAAARPSEFLAGWGAIVLVLLGAGIGLLAFNQDSRWMFALLAGVVAHAFALVAWQFTLYREKQRLFYEKLAAQEANRMKTEFLNHMTHELRTPITAIMGFNKVNQFTDDLGREQRVHNSEIVGRNCEHLLALINNNLDIARIEAGQLPIERKPEDVSSLLEDLVSTLRIIAAEKRLLLSLKIEGALPHALSVDAIRLRQVLLNLVGNAIKFTEKGEVVLEANWDAGNLRLCVRDTGSGIPPESLARVFEPFQRGVGDARDGNRTGSCDHAQAGRADGRNDPGGPGAARGNHLRCLHSGGAGNARATAAQAGASTRTCAALGPGTGRRGQQESARPGRTLFA